MTQPRITIGSEKLLTVANGASEQLRSLLERQGRPDGALRVKVIGGGCSGLQYQMDLVDGPLDRDILVESNGVKVVIDPKSALFVGGSELDSSAVWVLATFVFNKYIMDLWREVKNRSQIVVRTRT